MNEAWTIATMIASFVVLARMVGHLNRMYLSCVPFWVTAAIVLMGVGSASYMLSPFYGEEYTWRDFLFASAAAVWSWLDRRYPNELFSRSSQRTSEAKI